jgi:hypothetical protein
LEDLILHKQRQLSFHSGQQPNRDIYVGGKLVSRESITGSFERVFMVETLDTAFTDRLGVEMGLITTIVIVKPRTVDRIISVAGGSPTYLDLTSNGRVKALDLAPSSFFFRRSGFESYSKVGVIVPINGKLVIETTQTIMVQQCGKQRTIVQEDEKKP